MNPEQCIAICRACSEACRSALKLCLDAGGPLSDPKLCLRLAEAMRLCQLCADWSTTEPEIRGAVCQSCARECDDSADACDALRDARLDPCAAELRRCAAACRAISEAHDPATDGVTGPSTGPDTRSIGLGTLNN